MREHRRKAEEQYNTEEIIEWLQARCKHNMAEQIRKEFL